MLCLCRDTRELTASKARINIQKSWPVSSLHPSIVSPLAFLRSLRNGNRPFFLFQIFSQERTKEALRRGPHLVLVFVQPAGGVLWGGVGSPLFARTLREHPSFLPSRCFAEEGFPRSRQWQTPRSQLQSQPFFFSSSVSFQRDVVS